MSDAATEIDGGWVGSRQEKGWPFTPTGTAVRIFLTAWIVFTLHFAPNIVREIYPALSIGDHLSFRVDEYANLHPDLFETEGRGWHIGNNPGASMVAAVPYVMVRPVIESIVRVVQARRALNPSEAPPEYDSPWPLAREFHARAWQQGLDVKLGLAAFVMQSLCMAVVSALAVVLMFFLLRTLIASDRQACLLALLYAFGTPVLFRTGFLNHNLMLGHIAFLGFIGLWNPFGKGWSSARKLTAAGLAGGTAVLFDYSGLVFLAALFVYGVWRESRGSGASAAVRAVAWFALGGVLPLGLLLLYQWTSFGNPFLPGQHWMAPVEWIDRGYQGYGWPQPALFGALGFDHRFGLFSTSPILLLAVAYPWLARRSAGVLARRELSFILLTLVALWLFFSGSNYTRLQYNTGLRYMAPILPFLFVPAALALIRLRPKLVAILVLASVTSSWALAMYRDVESGLGVLRPLVQLVIGGFQLPVLQSLTYARAQYGSLFPSGVSPLALFAIVGALLYIIWRPGLSGAAARKDSRS